MRVYLTESELFHSLFLFYLQQPASFGYHGGLLVARRPGKDAAEVDAPHVGPYPLVVLWIAGGVEIFREGFDLHSERYGAV